MKAETVEKNYAIAKERYAELGIDTDKAIATLEKTPISLHCWQADDVVGFERNEALSGGIQTTGNYPGRARNIGEVRQDLEKVQTLLAGTFRVNLHEIYGEFGISLLTATKWMSSISKVGCSGQKSMISSSISTLPASLILRVDTCHWQILTRNP
jgi:hypothetical protein